MRGVRGTGKVCHDCGIAWCESERVQRCEVPGLLVCMLRVSKGGDASECVKVCVWWARAWEGVSM